MPDGGKGVLEHGLVVAVEVTTRQRAAVVPDNHAVWIQHGHDLEHKRVAQQLQTERQRTAMKSHLHQSCVNGQMHKRDFLHWST